MTTLAAAETRPPPPPPAIHSRSMTAETRTLRGSVWSSEEGETEEWKATYYTIQLLLEIRKNSIKYLWICVLLNSKRKKQEITNVYINTRNFKHLHFSTCTQGAKNLRSFNRKRKLNTSGAIAGTFAKSSPRQLSGCINKSPPSVRVR